MTKELSSGDRYLRRKVEQIKSVRPDAGESSEVHSIKQAIELLKALRYDSFAQRETAWKKLSAAIEYLKDVMADVE